METGLLGAGLYYYGQVVAETSEVPGSGKGSQGFLSTELAVFGEKKR